MSEAATVNDYGGGSQRGEAWSPQTSSSVPLDELLGAFNDDSGSSKTTLHAERRRTIDAVLRQAAPVLGGGATTGEVGKVQLIGFLLGTVLPPHVATRQAEELLARYGTLGGLLAAPAERLAAHLRSGEAAVLLKILQMLVNQAAREPIEERPLLDSSNALNDYLSMSMRHESVEMVRLLFLDSANRLIGEEVHSRGTINHCPLYPREVVRRVIEMNANALIIVHNHPSGDASPSEQDTGMTRILWQTLDKIGVSLHDHVIIGANRNYSYRENGCLTDG